MNGGGAVSLDPSLAGRCAGLLTRAFMSDPLYIHVQPVEDRRRRALTWMHGRVLRYCLRHGMVHVSPGMEGVACWLPPGGMELPPLRIVTSGLLAMPAVFGPAPYRRFDRYLHVSGILRQEQAPEKYWYLWLLGVEPAHQGKGIGGSLLQPVLAESDAAGVPCYTETEEERNLDFYGGHGFRVTSQVAIPGSELKTWSMLRPPV
ncbi:MAG: GNAT family N-acetyltransferase [Spirochaetes bacterium]|nr:GNAT family N-acetyltransferase [Spirochaetota bacterium]